MLTCCSILYLKQNSALVIILGLRDQIIRQCAVVLETDLAFRADDGFFTEQIKFKLAAILLNRTAAHIFIQLFSRQ